MIKPLQVLHGSLNKSVIVSVKGNREYRGILDGYDQHMNLVLKKVEELINGESKGVYEIMVLRGDNVVFVSP